MINFARPHSFFEVLPTEILHANFCLDGLWVCDWRHWTLNQTAQLRVSHANRAKHVQVINSIIKLFEQRLIQHTLIIRDDLLTVVLLG